MSDGSRYFCPTSLVGIALFLILVFFCWYNCICWFLFLNHMLFLSPFPFLGCGFPFGPWMRGRRIHPKSPLLLLLLLFLLRPTPKFPLRVGPWMTDDACCRHTSKHLHTLVTQKNQNLTPGYFYFISLFVFSAKKYFFSLKFPRMCVTDCFPPCKIPPRGGVSSLFFCDSAFCGVWLVGGVA